MRISRGEIGANRIDPSGRSAPAHERILNQFRAILQNTRGGQVRIPFHIMRGQDEVLHLHTVKDSEATAEIIEALAELRFAVQRLVFARVRFETQVSPQLERRRARPFGRRNASAAQPAGQVNPAVRTEQRPVHAQLRARIGGEPSQQHLLFIGPAIAIGVFEVKNVRRASHDQTSAPGHQPVGKRQSSRKFGSAIEDAIVIGVREQRNPAHRRALRPAGRVTAILRHEQTALSIPGNRARGHG
jgi:hypothetical protein